MKTLSGSCLCGAVTFECKDTFTQFHLCHCKQCQKISGSAYVSNLFTDKTNIRWLSGKALVKQFDLPHRTLSNAFCVECGTAVPFVCRAEGELIIPAGCLNDAPTKTPEDHIFWSERARWYDDGVKAQKCKKGP